MKKIALFIPIIAGLLACNSASKDATSSTSDTLSYTLKSYEKHSQNCISKDSLCATVQFSYPVFGNATFDETIKEELINIFHNEEDSTKARPKNFEELAKPFVEEYDKQIKEGASYATDANKVNEDGFLAMPWNMESQTTVQRQTDKYLMLHTNTYWFMGGMHPVSMEYYYVYDRATFKRIRLEDLFVKDFDQKLLLIAEKHFRKQEGLKPADKLDDVNGYFFENEKFLLNDNFTLTPTGIKFLYNVYEIKSYAAGVTELEIPYGELKDILK